MNTEVFIETVWFDSGRYKQFLALLAYIAGTGLAADGVHLDESYADAFEGRLSQTHELEQNWYTLPLGEIQLSVLRAMERYVGFRISAPLQYAREIRLAIHATENFIPKA